MNDESTVPPASDGKVKVDADKCIGCGICTSIAPDVFEMNESGKSVVKDSAGASADEAKSACPVGAIEVE